MTDIELEQKIEGLKNTIVSWAEENDLMSDTFFTTWSAHFDDEPGENPVVLVMTTEGPLYDVLNSLGENTDYFLDGFIELIESTGFMYEMYDNVTVCFYAEDEQLADLYKDYFEWRWICDLITPDYSNLYEEVFQRFSTRSEDLYRLEPRKYEILLDSVFRNNGFRTELGPGQGDGGVDIRLYSNDVIGEAVTLVQAKRYSPSNPIELQAVQALYGAVCDQKAHRGLFVTTSRYLPVAKEFAARQNSRLQLATSIEVEKWSEYAAINVMRDKSTLISTSNIYSIFQEIIKGGIANKVFHSRIGYNMIDNEFLALLKETKTAALVIILPKAIVADYGLNLSGCHAPVIDVSVIPYLDFTNVFRVKKKVDQNGKMYLWGKHKLYTQWDGKPQHFDLCD